METEIHAIKKADVIEASMDGKKALITVRFDAEEITVTRDGNGTVVDGHPERVRQMRDVWTFARVLRARDPRWLVMETRAAVEGGDNDTVPNSH